MKKLLKITGKILLALIVILVLLFGYVYIKYNEPLPKGVESAEADALANKMLTALNYEAFQNTRYLSWTFPGGHKYIWDKDQYKVNVSWDEIQVTLDLKTPNNSTVTVEGKNIEPNKKKAYIQTALSYFHNDSFWLVAPYKVFDSNTSRSIATNEAGKKGLLITYNAGGTTPGDSYLWFLDENGRPTGYQMWVNIIPIGGLYASWEDWKKMESGIQLSSTHKLFILDLNLENIKAWNEK
ncbi:hypothetical protein [Kordia zhangzhouensis]|uniref:hypothetical protein n=1 Tax=Kordia zhangzhouensis TaxID=1620405 RepID=UPI0006293011|nr:hypothetical protein [Kordia zhangzhouensis]